MEGLLIRLCSMLALLGLALAPQVTMASSVNAQACNFVDPLGATCDANPILGTVFWPDGLPAANVRVDLMPNGPTDFNSWVSPTLPEVVFRTNSDGTYAAQGCPCYGLMGFLIFDDGRSGPCSIIMGAFANGFRPTTPAGSLAALKGITASPGDQVDWMVAPIRCSSEVGVFPQNIDRQWLALKNQDPKTCHVNCDFGGPMLTWKEVRDVLVAHPGN